MSNERTLQRLRISDEVHNFIKAYAEENHTSIASVVRKALSDFIKTKTQTV